MIHNHDDESSREVLLVILSHMVDVTSPINHAHKSAQGKARTSGHPIWSQELLPLDLSRLLTILV